MTSSQVFIVHRSHTIVSRISLVANIDRAIALYKQGIVELEKAIDFTVDPAGNDG